MHATMTHTFSAAPKRPERRSTATDEPETAFSVGARKRVLIADDNRDWADGLAWLLEDEGYAVHTAYDGRQAIEAARKFLPHIVVLDIRMPAMTGYEAARIFNRHPQSTRPVLVAITAWPGEAGRQHATTTGFDHYLAKPADPFEVLELLRNI
jgi:CheY-like chemotaxis protein